MTAPDDTPFDDSSLHPDGETGTNASDAEPGPAAEPSLPLDEEAAWLLIVENYGERPQMGPDPFPDRPEARSPQPPPVAPPVDPPVHPLVDPPARPPVSRPSFDRSYLDALDAGPGPEPAAGRHDDEHFVPPEPPPVPHGTPARRIAWACLFGAPLVMLLAVVLGRSYPMWASVFLVAAFVGGFVFLIATMPRHGGDGHDDGAVV
jgi:hypothetical protein